MRPRRLTPEGRAEMMRPVLIGGVLGRLVPDNPEETVWRSERWMGPAEGWVPALTVADVLKGIPTSAETLEAFRVPKMDWPPASMLTRPRSSRSPSAATSAGARSARRGRALPSPGNREGRGVK
jgi:hypothetical protein